MAEQKQYSFYQYITCTPADYEHLTDSRWYYPIAYTLSGVNVAFVIKGLILNIFCFIIVGKDQSDSVMSGILRFVAVGDELALLSNLLDLFCHIIESRLNNSAFTGESLGYIHSINWIFKASFGASRSWSMMYLAVSRCIYIIYPMKAVNIITPSRSFKFLTTVYVILLIINVPKIFETVVSITTCNNLTIATIGSSKFMPSWYIQATTVVLNSLIPMSVTVIANILLLRKLYLTISGRKFLSSLKSKPMDNDIQKNASVIKTVLMLSTLFIVCQTPMLSYGFIVLSHQSAVYFNIFNLVGLLVSNIDSSCNFWIYVTSNSRFKRHMFLTIPFLKPVVYRSTGVNPSKIFMKGVKSINMSG